MARSRPLGAEVRLIQRFDDSFTELWESVAPKFDFAVQRDAAYLNWKYVTAPHVRYSIAALRRDDRNVGYAVYRHLHEPRGRVTLLVDFLDRSGRRGRGSRRCLRWVDREARQADSDKIRTFAMHAAFRKALRRAGYFQVKSTVEFVAKVNAVDLRAVVLRQHRQLARHARRFGSGSMIGARGSTLRRFGGSMHLLVGIDTEGDNQWDAAARANQTFENIYALPRLHALFARHGVRPTYVITYPVASDPRSAEVLSRLLEGGDCEIGAHHHAWETPPFSPDDVRRHPYASSLPRAQFEAQLDVADRPRSTRAVGQRPVSYRSGRFGFSADHVAALERARYLVESSVAPLFYETHKGGPDFVEAPAHAVLPRLRQRRRGRAAATCSKCRSPPA